MSKIGSLGAVLICLAVWGARVRAQTQPAAGPPAAAPTAPVTSTKAAVTPLPDPQTPTEFFARARQLSDLEASGIPFHLKATYVASGDTEFTGNGTYEEWWQSKDVWQKEATLGDYRYVAIQNGGKQTAAATTAYIPLRAREVMGLQIFHIAMPKEKKGGWKISQGTVGSGAQEIATQEQLCDSQRPNFLCTQQFEFTLQGWVQSYRVNDLSETYTNFQPFEKLFFPRKIAVTLRGDSLLTVEIVSLETLSDIGHGLMDTKIPPALSVVPSQVFEGFSPQKDVMAPKIIHNVRVKYPKSERKSHSEGLVIVVCAIDTTGSVREPYVQLSDGTAFDQAAIEAIRKWRFRPAAKNGKPGMTDTKILINFRLY